MQLYPFHHETVVVHDIRQRALDVEPKLVGCPETGVRGLAASFPVECGVRQLDLVSLANGGLGGKLLVGLGRRGDPLCIYSLTVLASGRTFEAWVLRSDRSRIVMAMDGRERGHCEVRPRTNILNRRTSAQWTLVRDGALFGTVSAGWLVRSDSLRIDRPAAEPLPVRLAMRSTFCDFCRAMGRLVTLRFLTTPAPPPPAHNAIIPQDAPALADPEDELFYFAALLVFRSCIFDTDFSGGGQ